MTELFPSPSEALQACHSLPPRLGRELARDWFWHRLETDKSYWSHLQKPQQGRLFTSMPKLTLSIHSKYQSQDGTQKFVFELADGLKTEAVYIPFFKRPSLCLSTQVGCGMNCHFCYTGKMGFKRSLTTQEILAQYVTIVQELRKNHHEPTDLQPAVVFMGQGEPFVPFEAVKRSIEWMLHPAGFNLSPRQITISTVGHIPHLKRYPELYGINLALSLHSPFDSERTSLIPMNELWPLDDVLKLIDQFSFKKRQFLVCEYLLIENLNMSPRHAEALEKLLKHRRAILNLIPFNPFPGSSYQRPSLSGINEFKKELVARKLPVLVRTTKGEDILAACGQLHSQENQI